MNLPSLYELAGEYRALADRLHDLELDDQTIADTLEGESADLVEKGKNVAFVFRNLESIAEQLKAEELRLSNRRKAFEKRAANLKNYLLTNMERAGINKIESPWFVISVRQNPEAVSIESEDLIPKDYFREIPAKFEVDKTLIKQAIKDGHEVPGCRLTRSTRLEIK